MRLTDCPPNEALAAYVSGALEEESVQSVSEHVEVCPSCEEAVCNLESSSDRLLEKLRLPLPQDPFAEEEGCDRAIELVKEIGLEPTFIGEDATVAGSNPGDASNGKKAPPPEIVGMLGQYELIKKLGQGGMGAVYKAKHTRLRRIVALKVLPANLLQDEAAIARFDREMQAVGALDHPNIIRASDAGEIDGTHYLVMELIKGDDLAVVARRRGRLPVADACEVIRQAAVGLQHAMENGLVHRDIKPANLMLSQKGQVKILDMGLALLETPFGDDDGLTSTGQIMGTVDYMAPEQVTNSHNVDIRGDIYALGCTIDRLLSGVAPFQDGKYDNVIFKAMAHVDTPPLPLGERRAGLPAELLAIVDRTLGKKPADRFQTPTEQSSTLREFHTVNRHDER
ncbi:Serine/threonine-protein kinase PknB [Rosistilla carotiformis]|uniref:Serine/threonine-protein kinase PknB n=1 Tax=Rosistilla carotiformis TaxID=2528017 RepID=A0A518JY85_9BACT|nr:serine/threonine-protein kinase [Rosistilla carotiformis]QDV70499.1 Serine/threonine-protein kinase PknB [Rosistilla carotiformis]